MNRLWDDGSGREAAVADADAPHANGSTVCGPRCRFHALVEDGPEIVTLLDRRGGLIYMNAAGRGLLAHEVLTPGESVLGFVHPADRDDGRRVIAQVLSEPGRTQRFELRVVRADGSCRHLETTARNCLDDPAVGAVVLHSRDVTEHRQTEAILDHERSYDPLTQLPNRGLFTEHLDRAMAREPRVPGFVAIYNIDIDGFRHVNERHGFDVGNEVLRCVGDRLRRVLRSYDVVSRGEAVVARFAGDEFFVLCEDVLDARSAERIAARLGAAIAEMPVPSDRGDIAVTATVGVVLGGGDGADPESLLVRAGAALRVGKERGGASVQFFDERIREAENLEAERVEDLREAIATGQLRLLYQPKIEISSGEMVAVEALVRWEHPERGLVSPLEFIPLAERTGLIGDLGRWVLEEACRQRQAWESVLPAHSRLIMCVNVSSFQFNASFPDLARAVLAQSEVPRGSLCIEITESAVMTDVDNAIATLQGLRFLGVKVAIDDFGTGFSSLAQLKRLPLDELKIDKSFVDGLGDDREDTAIVAAVVAMAQALDLSVVAEGVETPDQLAELRTLGCELAQGFLFSRPIPPDQILELLTGDAHLGYVSAVGLPADDGRGTDVVLVVDDSSDVRRFARVSLAASGFEVLEAAQGDEAITMARRLRPACLVLDVSMPGLSGFEVCRTLRADPSTAGCTVVMLTANASADDKVKAFSAGADDYMVKPFAPRDIASRVRSAINRRRQGTSLDDGPPEVPGHSSG